MGIMTTMENWENTWKGLVGNKSSSDEFLYRMLSRWQRDCEYYLNCGSRNTKHLWASNVPEQIYLMKRCWEYLAEKPEWISWLDILRYAVRMLEPDEVTEETVIEYLNHAHDADGIWSSLISSIWMASNLCYAFGHNKNVHPWNDRDWTNIRRSWKEEGSKINGKMMGELSSFYERVTPLLYGVKNEPEELLRRLEIFIEEYKLAYEKCTDIMMEAEKIRKEFFGKKGQ